MLVRSWHNTSHVLLEACVLFAQSDAQRWIASSSTLDHNEGIESLTESPWKTPMHAHHTSTSVKVHLPKNASQ